MTRRLLGIWLVAALIDLSAGSARADGADVEPSPLDSSVVIQAGNRTPAGSNSAIEWSTDSESGVARVYEYEWLLSCSANQPGTDMADCGTAQTCVDPDHTRWVLWAREVDGGTWFQYATECLDEEPQVPGQPARPSATPAMVEEAVRRMGLPSLPVHVQPAEATLVNFDTIFFAEPVPFDRSVTLVGYDVRVVAEPVSYGWSFGDGSSLTTHLPGAPYPAKDVVHRYDDAHVTVQPSVDVTYRVRYSVDGGATQQLGTTLTAQGPSTGLRIREASALLAGSG